MHNRRTHFIPMSWSHREPHLVYHTILGSSFNACLNQSVPLIPGLWNQFRIWIMLRLSDLSDAQDLCLCLWSQALSYPQHHLSKMNKKARNSPCFAQASYNDEGRRSLRTNTVQRRSQWVSVQWNQNSDEVSPEAHPTFSTYKQANSAYFLRVSGKIMT